MSGKRIDRRVKYTRMVIKASFLSILKEKPISKITIKEICERADINRATFYAHFTDTYGLLQHIETEFLEDIHHHLDEVHHEGNEGRSLEIITSIVQYIRENADLCAILISEKGDLAFQQRLMMITQTQFVHEAINQKGLDQETAEYYFTFSAFGSAGIIQKWLTDGLLKSDEEIASLIFEISHHGFQGLGT